MLLIFGFEVDFNLLPQMFAVRNRFANPQTKTLSPQFADLRTCGPVCGSAQHWLVEMKGYLEIYNRVKYIFAVVFECNLFHVKLLGRFWR